MRWIFRKKAGTFSDAEDGVVAAEFVILFPLFLLVIAGIVEFGHLFYVRHALTNGSREGARAAVVYYTPAAGRADWASTQAVAAVENYLDNFIRGQYNKPPVVTFLTAPGNDPGAVTGNHLRVTVTANSYLLILDKLVPALSNITLMTETTMRLE